MLCKIEVERKISAWPTRHVTLTCQLPKSGNFKEFVKEVNDIWRQIPEGSRTQDFDSPYFSWLNNDCFQVQWTRAATEEENRIADQDYKQFVKNNEKRRKQELHNYVEKNLEEVKEALKEIESKT